MEKAIFLDRDGVINRSIIRQGKPYPPQSMGEFEWVDDIHETLETLKKSDYILTVFTNQPDVARGRQSKRQVESFHHYIRASLPIDQIYTCFHDNGDHCECRKPKPGMIYRAQADWQIDLGQSYVVGDRWRDIDAGNEAGCQTIWIDYGYEEALRSSPRFKVQQIKQILDIIP